LEQLVNGVHRRVGPLSVDLTSFARSLPSLHQLLPEYACVETGDDLASISDTVIPELCPEKIADSMSFYAQLRDAESRREASLTTTHAIVGINQPTSTTVALSNGRVVSKESFVAENLFGDSTVPLVAACRSDVPMDSNMVRRVSAKHGSLQRNGAALDELEGILTARSIRVRAAGSIEVGVGVPELAFAGDAIPIEIELAESSRVALRIVVSDEAGDVVASNVRRGTGGPILTTIDALAPGAYTIDVGGLQPGVTPVSSSILVWPSN
jgi:hypothetical protein